MTADPAPAATPYDALPYPTFTHAQLHPDRIGTVGYLAGLDTAAAGGCAYLELGCGDAGTLLALAYALPGSRFVGYDLAPTAVARAQQHVDALGLTNVEVRVGDVAALPEDLGTFDYIVSHGVFSWVPEPARDGILRTFGRHLADDGVAYVSYNANPSGLLREMSRQMLRFHLRRSELEPDAAFEEARNLLGFVSQSRAADDPWRVLLESELQHLRDRPASSFVHDELAEENTPFWLHDVIDLAAAHGLRWLGESDDVGTSGLFLSGPAQALLANLEDEPEVREQYLDFFLARRFRQTLLCRQDRDPVRPIPPERTAGVLVASDARPESDSPVELADGEPVGFVTSGRPAVSVRSAAVKAALCLLGPRWPAPATVPSLLEGVRTLVGEAEDDEVELGRGLLQLAAPRTVRLSRHVPTWPLSLDDVAERPVASRLARRQAERGSVAVANLRAEPITLDPVSAAILCACDGETDRASLVGLIAPMTDADQDAEAILEDCLRQLVAAALLES